MADETFDFGLAKEFVNYLSDDGNHYAVVCRKGYVASGAFGAPVCAENAFPRLPVHRKPRYVHLEAAPDVNGKVLKRKVVCNASILTAFAASGTPINPTIDGIAWEVTGFTGEHTVG